MMGWRWVISFKRLLSRLVAQVGQFPNPFQQQNYPTNYDVNFNWIYSCQFKFSVQKMLEMNVCVKLENKIKKIARHNRFQALIQTPRVVTISMT